MIRKRFRDPLCTILHSSLVHIHHVRVYRTEVNPSYMEITEVGILNGIMLFLTPNFYDGAPRDAISTHETVTLRSRYFLPFLPLSAVPSFISS